MVTVKELMALKNGVSRSMAAGSPPTMHTRSPEAAAAGPPVTPQSSTATPRAAASAPMAWTHGAEMVLTTTKVVPGPAAARPPPGPLNTACTCWSSTTATTTTSARATRSADEAATSAFPSYLPVASGRRSQTTRGNPSRSTLVATPSPMAPSPITPTVGRGADGSPPDG